MMIQQQLMMQQPIQVPHQLMKQQIIDDKNEYKNILFRNPRLYKGKLITNISVKYGTTVEDLLNKYIDRVYGFKNVRLNFIYNANVISINEHRAVEDFFKQINPLVQVSEIS